MITLSPAKTYRFATPTLKQIKCCFFGRRLAVKILKPLDYFLFINTQKQSPSAGFELAIFRLRLAWNTSSLLTAPLTPQKNIWLRSYTWLGNTRILRPIWRKSVQKQRTYTVFMRENVKNRVFFDFWRPPRPEIKNRASSLHAVLQYATFEGSLMKIGWETKKFIHLQIWWSSPSNVNTYIYTLASVWLTASFPIS